ncbi:MAG: pseudouridine synthase [Planctomycetota bacterium]
MPRSRSATRARRESTPPELADASRGERLQRVMADAGVASRRGCEALIEAGSVEVNGQLVTELPIWVDPNNDRIVVEGRPLPKVERQLYILLNKPTRTLTTAKDEPGSERRTVVSLVNHPERARLVPVGRLDYDTTGLLLMTNDGELVNRLTHPRYGVPKKYRAVVKGRVDPEAIGDLEQGIYLAERREGRTVGAVRTSRVELRVVFADRERTTLEITLREGRNRQVRRMLAAVGFPVKKLERIGMGPLSLKGVPRGGWRELKAAEVKALKRAAASPEDGDGRRGGKGRRGRAREASA